MKKFLSGLLALVLCFSLTACTTDQVFADINVADQIATTILQAVGTVAPGDAAFISELSTIASNGIEVIEADYKTYKASGAATDLAKLQAALTAFQVNLPAALAAVHITDAASAAKVTNWVNLLVTSVAAIVAALPQLTSAQVSAVQKASVAVSLPTAKVLQARWASEVCQGDKACGKLVKVKKHFFGL
jgi:hypothetical protein